MAQLRIEQVLRRLLDSRLLAAASSAWIAASTALMSGCESTGPGMPSLSPVEPPAAKPGAPAGGTAGQLEGRSQDSGGDAPVMTVAPDVQPATEPTFPADWCTRAGSDPDTQFATIFDIAIGYATDQSEDCETSGLTHGLDGDQLTNWLNYLFGYTNAMTGCPLAFEPVEGGILAFGPANLAALGMSPPVLGRDDAGMLIGQYLARFASALQLSAAERSAVEAYLWDQAQPAIDPAASQLLSVCGQAAPSETDGML